MSMGSQGGSRPLQLQEMACWRVVAAAGGQADLRGGQEAHVMGTGSESEVFTWESRTEVREDMELSVGDGAVASGMEEESRGSGGGAAVSESSKAGDG
ncbi:hypothetical protein ZEAMMB73_Zm00001d005953 [Zea mays]|nr:hypothetical protein ZEAMMB73_Zm00001d005953 [Zea mays]